MPPVIAAEDAADPPADEATVAGEPLAMEAEPSPAGEPTSAPAPAEAPPTRTAARSEEEGTAAGGGASARSGLRAVHDADRCGLPASIRGTVAQRAAGVSQRDSRGCGSLSGGSLRADPGGDAGPGDGAGDGDPGGLGLRGPDGGAVLRDEGARLRGARRRGHVPGAAGVGRSRRRSRDAVRAPGRDRGGDPAGRGGVPGAGRGIRGGVGHTGRPAGAGQRDAPALRGAGGGELSGGGAGDAGGTGAVSGAVPLVRGPGGRGDPRPA